MITRQSSTDRRVGLALRVGLSVLLTAPLGVGGQSVGAPPTEEQPVAPRSRPIVEEDRLVAEIQRRWSVRIRSIRNNLLHSASGRLRREGRERILAIRDPLAILPLMRVLSEGECAAREVLVAALSEFPQDEATMNLAIIALTDDDERVRRSALIELKRRGDARVIPEFRRALQTDNDTLIRRAATALGVLQAREAVPELIDLLIARRRRPVEVSVHSYFQQYPLTFGAPLAVWHGHFFPAWHYPALPSGDIGLNLVQVARRYEMRDVTVYRTEVLEALRAISGQSFGFDPPDWWRWYQEQQP